jgi:hypothetical protein
MKLRVPDGCCAASFAGRAIDISGDGSIEVDDGVHVVLLTHRFKPWDGRGSSSLVADPPDMSGKMTPVIDRNGTCTEVAAAEAPAPVEMCESPGSGAAATDAGIDEISALNRRALFAVLREMGVSVSLPITNGELRAAVRRAHGG